MYMKFHWTDYFAVLKALRESAQKHRDAGDIWLADIIDKKADIYEEKNILGKTQ